MKNRPEPEWEAPEVGEVVHVVAMGQRVSRLEGSYEHMASRAELAEAISRVETRFLGRIIAVVSLGTGIVVAVDRLVG